MEKSSLTSRVAKLLKAIEREHRHVLLAVEPSAHADTDNLREVVDAFVVKQG